MTQPTQAAPEGVMWQGHSLDAAQIDALIASGWRELERGRLLDANDFFQVALMLSPQDARSWQGIAQIHHKAGRTDLASGYEEVARCLQK